MDNNEYLWKGLHYFCNYNYNFEHIFLEYIAIQDHMDEIYKDHG